MYLYVLLGLLSCSGMKAQTASDVQVIPVNFEQSTAYFTSLSDNGLWAVAVATDGENTALVGWPYLVNAVTGEMTKLWTGDVATGFSANDVTDDGKMVVGSANGAPAYYDVDAGKWVSLPGSGEAYSVTPDGKRIAGFAFGELDDTGYLQNTEHPRVWDRQSDGTYRQLDVDAEFENFPRQDKTGSLTAMRRITNMSADGNILAGAMNFVYIGLNCYYVYDCTTHETMYVDNLLPDGFRTGSFIDQSNMSNNGAYMTGHSNIIDSGTGTEYLAAYKMNIADGTLELFNTYSDEQDRGGFAVSNAGTVFASSPAVNPLRYLYIRAGKLWYGLDEIMSGSYGINIYERLNQDCTGYAVDVSDDEQVLLGMSMATGAGYVIRLPETFTEAVTSIDPLEAYTVNPAEGSSFARFRQATISFTKPTSVVSGGRAHLLDETGESIYDLNISERADGTSFVIGGRPLTLEAGKEYTVYIPAGTFQLTADNSFKNKDIRIKYMGRENAPVKVTGISPSDGTNVSEISTSQPVRVSFDMNVSVATDSEGNSSVGYLYESGSDAPLCELTITALNNQVGLAPALRRYLRNGIDYKVVIPAGSVTDIMGDCGNEEITVNYHGAYVPETPAGGDLFFDDFNDPSNSMARYLLYEGDHNNPSAIPDGWGFDADNNPWNFTLRSEDSSTDYCAGSHSMYSPAGKSDDWMSLPQLIMENGDYYLSFDAQSFSFTAKDVLKVYVLEEEAGYSQSDAAELVGLFKDNGKVIFEEQLTPGESQDELEGDWTPYEVSLSEFAGKSIYIAFVNENEDQSAIFLDNVRVYYRGDFVLSSATETAVVDQASVKVSAQINITGDDTYNDVTATVKAGDFTSSYSATGLGLTKNSPAYTFDFPDEMPLTVGEENAYTISVTLDGTTVSRSSSVKNLAFQTTKRVLVEEGTGQWCGNCPAGILALENLEELFGDKVVSIGVHSGGGGGSDVFAYEAYATALGFTAYPTGSVNRIDTLYMPTYTSATEGSSFNSPEGNVTFLDIVQREFEQNPVVDADIEVSKAVYDITTRRISIEGNINYAVNLSQLNQNIAFIIIENGLSGWQTNYFYTNSDPLFGRFGQGGEFGESHPTITFDHVARRVVDDYFAGLQGMVPSSVSAGEPVAFSIQRNAYDNVSDWANAEVAVVLLNNNTGRVVNVVKAPFTVIKGVEDAGADGISIFAADGSVNVIAGGAIEAAVYDVSGKLVGMESGSDNVSVNVDGNGLYIVKAVADGKSVVRKVVVR